jgi:hypothetical protein
MKCMVIQKFPIGDPSEGDASDTNQNGEHAVSKIGCLFLPQYSRE